MNVSSVKNLNGQTFSAVQDAALTNVVQTNSAQWAEGGGGSVSSKYGTIRVSGSNIEATNKAIEFKSNGFTSSFNDIRITYGAPPTILTWDDYSQGTNLSVQVFNETSENATLSYSSNTNVTGEVTAASYDTIQFDLQTPNATSIQFTTDKIFVLQRIMVTAPSSFKASELAWKSDLPTYEYDSNHKVSAINGNELVGNEDYLVEQGFVKNLTSPKGTIKVFNNNKVEGTNSAIASDVIEGFVSAYNGFIVQPGTSSTITLDRYVPNTMLFVSGQENWQDHTLNYSANTNVTGVITVPTGGQVSVEIPSGATSLIIGNEDWSRTLYNFTVSADNYYEIGELAWASALPTYEYDSTNKISAINGSALAGGSEVPSGTMNVSGLEYNAVNEISAYNGSAIAQYGAEKQWLVHDDTLVHAANSAQYALGVNLSSVAQLLGVDETVLWDNGNSFTINVPESIYNFEKISVTVNRLGTTVPNQEFYTDRISAAGGNFYTNYIASENVNNNLMYIFTTPYNVSEDGKTITSPVSSMGAIFDLNGNDILRYKNNGTAPIFRIVGIGRKA